MTSVEFLDEIIQSKYSYKNNENTLRQFLTYEFYFLSNNISLNPLKFNTHSKINFPAVENYFTFPMIFTKCLFHALDSQGTHSLSLEDYVNGFTTLYTGNFDDKIKFIFKMFNINNDSYVHIEDIRCVLRYSHIYYDKRKIELLNQIIDDFFGRRRVFNVDDFIKRTIKKNCGLFFIILSILFDQKKFNMDVLNFIEDPEYMKNINMSMSPEHKSISGTLIKRAVSKFKMSSGHNLFYMGPMKRESKMSAGCFQYNTNGMCSGNSNYNTNTGSLMMKISQNEIVQYVQMNFGVELNPSTSLTNQGTNDEDSVDSEGSNRKNDDNSLEDDDCMIMLENLKCFEEDFESVKMSLLEQYFLINEFNIPKGSDGIEFQSGNISNLSSMFKNTTASKRSFNLTLLNANSDDWRGLTPKGGSLSPHKSSFLPKRAHNSTTMLTKVRSGSTKMFGTTFTDYAQSSLSLNHSDYFEEDVFIYSKKKDKLKKYSLIVLKGFIFVMNITKEEKAKYPIADHILSNFNNIGAKMFIPLHKLYINNVDYHYSVNNAYYYQVSLVSTVQFKKKNYIFIFKDKNHFSTLINLIIHQTNFISISEEYVQIKDIGKGSFSQTKLMRHIKTNLLYAVKKLNKNAANIEEFTTQNWERDIVKFLSNLPNIEHIFKCFRIIETLDHLYFITEYVQGGSLWNFIRMNKVCLQSSFVKKIIHQLSIGIKTLHYYGIVHRDLKLENVLMDYIDNNNFNAKIIDFGLSQVITPLAKTKETYGSLIFCSPEILLNIPYNVKVDIWSLGVIAYYLEYTYFPFGIKGNERDQETSNKIIMNDLKFPKKIDANNDQREYDASVVLLNVIKICLTKDINQRPSIDQIEKALSM